MAVDNKDRSSGLDGRVASDTHSRGDIQNLSRRSLLSWLGNATVLALTGDFLVACGGQSAAPSPSADITPAAPGPAPAPKATPKPAPAAPTTPPISNALTFAPAPVKGPIYDRWWGNTADPQDLQQILASWKLSVGGLVEAPRTLSFAEMLALPRQDQVTDFHCVEGWSVLDVPWSGVHFDSLINLVRPTAEATHVTFRAFGGVYTESLPLTVLREPRTLLAYGIGDGTLPFTHGFPLRLVVPRFHGYKGTKWVTEIEFTNASIIGYWEPYGYPTDAPVEAFRLREGKY